jgi:hypothetical protein
VSDFLKTKRDEINARLRELEPLVDEYRQLEAAAAALAGLPGTTTTTRRSSATPARRTTRRTTTRTTAARSDRAGRARARFRRSSW